VSKNLRRLAAGPPANQEEVNPVLSNTKNHAAYGWRRAALFQSDMPVFAGFKGGKKRTAPAVATATARHAAHRALNGPIT